MVLCGILGMVIGYCIGHQREKLILYPYFREGQLVDVIADLRTIHRIELRSFDTDTLTGGEDVIDFLNIAHGNIMVLDTLSDIEGCTFECYTPKDGRYYSLLDFEY